MLDLASLKTRVEKLSNETVLEETKVSKGTQNFIIMT